MYIPLFLSLYGADENSPGILFYLFYGLILIYSLATIIPSLAVCIRRLHDTGKSGWSLLFVLIPFIGSIILLIFLITDSQPGENKWGPNPKELASEIDQIGTSY